MEDKIQKQIPCPADIAKQLEAKETVTIRLDADITTFFKKEAKKHKISYGRLINQVLVEYVKLYDK